MAGATFTIPLITVIPGQLITAALWNNEFNNIGTNLNPSGLDGYSDTDTQMKIQTNPYPGSVTSHATSLGGEIERIRYQISQILGSTTPAFWYAAPPTDLTTIAEIIVPVGAIIEFPSATPPNSNFNLADGTQLDKTVYTALFAVIGYTFGVGAGNNFVLPNMTDRMSIVAGNLYALNQKAGALSQTLTDPGHSHIMNSHLHTLSAHTHATPGSTTGTPSATVGPGSGGGTLAASPTHTHSVPAGTSGTPSVDATSSTTSTMIANTTGITPLVIPTIPPYIGMYKMIRIQ